MSINNSFQNISNSNIKISSIPKWIKRLFLSIIPILGLSIYLNKNYSESINLKLNFLTEQLNYFFVKANRYNLGEYIILGFLFFFLYKEQKKLKKDNLSLINTIYDLKNNHSFITEKYIENYMKSFITPSKLNKTIYHNNGVITLTTSKL